MDQREDIHKVRKSSSKDESTVKDGVCPECNETAAIYNQEEGYYQCPNGDRFSPGGYYRVNKDSCELEDFNHNLWGQHKILGDKIEECLGVEIISVDVTLTLASNKGVKVGEIIPLPDAKYKVIKIHPDGQTVSVVEIP